MERNSAYPMVLTAMFIALVLLLGMTPIGLIPLGFINVTILCVPVIVGTILLGLKIGLLLGGCFGLASSLSMMGFSMTPPSALSSALFAIQPALALVMCFVPRLLVPVVTWLTYQAFAKDKKFALKALPPAAILGSLTNTFLYLGLMLLFYHHAGLDANAIIAIISGTGLIAGASEAATAAIITSPLIYAIWKTQHKI